MAPIFVTEETQKMRLHKQNEKQFAAEALALFKKMMGEHGYIIRSLERFKPLVVAIGVLYYKYAKEEQL